MVFEIHPISRYLIHEKNTTILCKSFEILVRVWKENDEIYTICECLCDCVPFMLFVVYLINSLSTMFLLVMASRLLAANFCFSPPLFAVRFQFIFSWFSSRSREWWHRINSCASSSQGTWCCEKKCRLLQICRSASKTRQIFYSLDPKVWAFQGNVNRRN